MTEGVCSPHRYFSQWQGQKKATTLAKNLKAEIDEEKIQAFGGKDVMIAKGGCYDLTG